MDSPIEPYKIQVPQSKLDILHKKLELSSFPDEASVADDWNYGAPREDVKRLTKYWQDAFDWRAVEAKLNEELPQFTTKVPVDGFGDLQIHFVHQKSKNKDAIPLLFCHGWPGSFIEVAKILPLLTKSGNGPSFHVVAPSLPNFGFSDPVGKPDFSIPQYAETMHQVMIKLGYDKYVTQGGDWGFIITRLMGNLYPSHCLASHWNYVYTVPSAYAKDPVAYARSSKSSSAEDAARAERTRWFSEEGYGYNKIQSTKPSTLGLLLADSPVGVLSWIYEKLHDWTDAYPWTDDEVLTWISIYVFSRGGPDASSRIYYENTHSRQPAHLKRFERNEHVKLGWSSFPRDLQLWPSDEARTLGPFVLEKRHESGGHFAAWERPKLLVGDLREMFGPGGGAQDVADRIVGGTS